MSFERRALAQRIRSEPAEPDRAVGAVERHWGRAGSETVDPDAFLNSVALNLHGFYNGVERILELIAVDLDGAHPMDRFFAAAGDEPSGRTVQRASSIGRPPDSRVMCR